MPCLPVRRTENRAFAPRRRVSHVARLDPSKGSLRAEIDALKERQREQDAFLEALQDPLRKDLAMRVLQDRNCAGSAGGAESTRQDETAIEQNGTVHHSTADRSTGENVRAAYGNALQSSASSLTTRSLVAASPHMDAAPMESDAVVTSGDAGSFSLSSVAPGTVGQIAVSVQESQMPFLARGGHKPQADGNMHTLVSDDGDHKLHRPAFICWGQLAELKGKPASPSCGQSAMDTASGDIWLQQGFLPNQSNNDTTCQPRTFSDTLRSYNIFVRLLHVFGPFKYHKHVDHYLTQDDLLSEGVPVEGSSAREPHRNPSTRSWHKQKNAIADLQATAYCAEAYSEALRQEHTQILSQVHDLHDALLKHVDCDDPAISMWLRHKREAMGGSGFGEIRSDGEVT
ncbi:hypothetical protein VDGL01_11118 [Verticillium dahliae]